MVRTRHGSQDAGATHHRPWRVVPTVQYSTPLRRRLRLVFVFSFLTLAITELVWNLRAPFEHIDSHLILVSGDRPTPLGQTRSTVFGDPDFLVPLSRRTSIATDFVAEDLAAFLPVGNQLNQQATRTSPLTRGDIREMSDFRLLRTNLAAVVNRSSDVVILYVASGCRVENGEAFFRWNVSRDLAGEGHNRLVEFLRQLSASDAEAKVLIVDAGTFERDPQSGMLVNEFPHLLQKAVHDTKDKRLWVLASNQSLERSHVLRLSERSVFGWFVESGLRGAADLDADQTVDLGELFRFVAVQVASYVTQATENLEHQTPMLFWGGGSLLDHDEWPILVPAGRRIAAVTDDRGHKPLLPMPTRDSIAGAFRNLPKGVVDSLSASGLTGPSGQPVDTAVSQAAEKNGTAGSEQNGTAKGAAEAKSGDQRAVDTGKPVDSTATTAPKPPADTPGNGSAVLSTAEREQLLNGTALHLQEAWGFRDELDESTDDSVGLSVAAPEDWRVLQERLLLHERLFRAGSVIDARQIAVVIRTIRDGMKSLANRTPLQFRGERDAVTVEILNRIYDRLQRGSFDSIQPHSLGFAELISRRARRPLATELKATIDRLDGLIGGGTAGEFAEWMSKLDSAVTGFVEIRLARQLADTTDISWPAKQLALKVRRQAERLAAGDLSGLAGLQQEFAEADQHRIVGERCLLDHVGQNREENGFVALRQANLLYDRAAANREVIRAARVLSCELTHRLPEYARWHGTSFPGAGAVPHGTDISQLADVLEQLIRVVDDPVVDQLPEIRKLDSELRLLRLRIESGLQPSVINRLNQQPLLPDAAVAIEAMLKTTLPRHAERRSLWTALLDIDQVAMAKFSPPGPEAMQHPSRVIPIVDWTWIRDQLDLERKIARICGANLPDPQLRLSTLDAAWNAYEVVFSEYQVSADADGIDDRLWQAYQSVTDNLRLFYQQVDNEVAAILRTAGNLQDPAMRDQQMVSLHASKRALLITRQRTPGRGQESPSFYVDQTEMFDLLSWHARRFVQEERFASSEDSHYFDGLIQSCRNQASRLVMQPVMAPPQSSKMAWRGPATISARSMEEFEAEARIEWSGAPRTPTWIGLLYDEEAVEVRVVGDPVIMLHSTTGISVDDLLTSAPPTCQLSPGTPRAIKLRIRVRTRSAQPSRIVLIASTGESNARKDINVISPLPATIDVAVKGVAGTWAEVDHHLNLHPFANRDTSYEFGLKNAQSLERQVDLRILIPKKPLTMAIPNGDLAVADAATLLASIGPADTLLSVPGLTLPVESPFVPIPFPKLRVAGPVAESPEAPSSNKPPEGNVPEDATSTSIRTNGLLFVLTDHKSQLSSIRRAVIAPQRPRRFLRANVRYDADRERIEITVEPIDRERIPASGIKVAGSFVEPLAANAARELEGEIIAPQYQAKLFAEVNGQAGRVMTLYLHVDGFPRAFTFRVPCSATLSQAPMEGTIPGIRLTSPLKGAAFRTPVDRVAVRMEVDAPDGAFQLPEDVVEVGVDRDNDRVLRGEPVEMAYTDRQVRVARAAFDQDGTFAIRMAVSDFEIDVPTSGLTNSSCEIIARLSVADRSLWSNPVPVFFDGAPPTIKTVRFKPAGDVVIGPELEVTVSVSDEISGTAKVEVALDTVNKGRFVEGLVKVAAKQDAAGNWVAGIPTAELRPGGGSLLVQAVDVVGNVSPPTVVKFSTITAKEAEVRQAALTVPISGSVSFGGMPAKDVTVSAKSAEGRVVATATTGQEGTFVLNGIGPGKWSVIAKGVIHNKVRQTEAAIEVTPPASPPAVRLQLK